MTEEDFRLYHWYAGQDGNICLLLGRYESGLSTLFVWVPPSTISTADGRMLIGPIAGPGKPPSAPKDRKEAERMAREWADTPFGHNDEQTRQWCAAKIAEVDALTGERDEWRGRAQLSDDCLVSSVRALGDAREALREMARWIPTPWTMVEGMVLKPSTQWPGYDLDLSAESNDGDESAQRRMCRLVNREVKRAENAARASKNNAGGDDV